MGFFKKKTAEDKLTLKMKHVSGIPNFAEGFPCDMTLNESEKTLTFTVPYNKEAPPVTLPIDKITKIGSESITEIKKQSKTGRAVAGGLLFGKTGAVVGALTADEKEKKKSVYVIRYTSNGEEKAITLEEYQPFSSNEITKRVKAHLPSQDSITL